MWEISQTDFEAKPAAGRPQAGENMAQREKGDNGTLFVLWPAEGVAVFKAAITLRRDAAQLSKTLKNKTV